MSDNREALTAEQRAYLALLDVEVYGGPEAYRATLDAIARRHGDHGPVLVPTDPEVLADLEARADYVRITRSVPWA